MFSTRVAWLALPFALLACAPAPKEASAGADELVQAKVWKEPEFISCAVETGTEGAGPFDAHRVRCTSNLPSDFPLSLEGLTSVSDKNGTTKSMTYAELAANPLVFDAFDDRFPVKVKVDLFVRPGSAEVANLPDLAPLAVETSFDVTTTTPFSAKLPFDVWPVTYVAREVTFVGTIPEQSIALGTLRSHGQPTLSTKKSTALAPIGETKHLLYLVGAGAKLEGTAAFNETSLPFTIDAPGTYAAFADGLRPVDASQPPLATNGAFGACTAQGSEVVCKVDASSGVVVIGATAKYVDGDVATDPVTMPNALAVPDMTKGEVVASFKIDAQSVAGLPSYIAQHDLKLKLSVADIAASKNNEFMLPFDTWPVTISVAPRAMALVTVPAHVVPMSATWHMFSSFEAEKFFEGIRENDVKKIIIPVDSQLEKIVANATLINLESGDQKDVSFEIKRGHSYNVTATELLDVTP
ncbi:MAG TPA: hypothetical protein VM925_17415 [Labilithrix sp.]|nr:hypothetical protein [Labilithrix sp.]